MENINNSPFNVNVGFKYPKIPGNVRECVLHSKREGPREFDGIFGRGRVHIICGSSGAGKSTLILDLLQQQKKAEMYLEHLGVCLRFMTIASDRGKLSNEETLLRMQLDKEKVNLHYMPATCSWSSSAERILKLIESETEDNLPQVVFIEGADMLVEDGNRPQYVTPFMVALQKIAEHYHVAIILSVGSPKSRPKDQYANRRDRSIGSEKWARHADDILALASPPGVDDRDPRRVLDIMHRNAAHEKFDLMFIDGRLIPYTPEVEKPDVFYFWASAQKNWWTAPHAVKALEGKLGRSSVYRHKDEALKAGLLEEKIDEKDGVFVYRWKGPQDVGSTKNDEKESQ